MYNKLSVMGTKKTLLKMKRNYWKPTPKKWRKIGDTFLAVSSVLAIGGLWQFDNLKDIFTAFEIKAMIVTSIALGATGKFLTNFFKEEETKDI
jgi:hypothetical protein